MINNYSSDPAKESGARKEAIDYVFDFFKFIGKCIIAIPLFIWACLSTLIKNVGWQAFLIFALGVPALLVAVFGIHDWVNTDYSGPWYDDYSLEYVYGDINNQGRVENVEYALYTKELIGCNGFRVTLPFGSDYYYEIHYFTEEDKWLGGEYITDYGVFDHDFLPSFEMEDGTKIVPYGIRVVLIKIDRTDITWLEKLSFIEDFCIDLYEPVETNSWLNPDLFVN